MRGLYYILDTLATLYNAVLLLRLIMQLVRADFRNPIGRAVNLGIKAADAAVLNTPEAALDLLVSVIPGGTTVYRSRDAGGNIQYVGITDKLARRAAEHLRGKGIRVEKVMGGLSRSDARAVDQALIQIHGLGKNGGTLLNRINSIAQTNPRYAAQVQRGYDLLKTIGYQ